MCDVDLSPAFQEPWPMVLSDFSHEGLGTKNKDMSQTAHQEKTSGSTKLQAQGKLGIRDYGEVVNTVCLKEREVT